MSWLILNEIGEIDRIENSAPDPELVGLIGLDVLEIEVPDGFPEDLKWDPVARDFVEKLDAVRTRQWAQIKAVRDQKLAVAPTPFGIFDSDETGKANINGQIAAFDNMEKLGMTLPDTIVWKLHDNTFATLTPTEFRQIGLMVAQHISDTYATSWQLEQQINAAETIADIQAVTWPAG